MNSIVSIYRRFPTKEDCLTHLEAVRWGDSPHCPYCKSERVSKHTEQDRRSRWQCSLCRKSFSVTVGTVFHNSHVDLQRWFLLISLMFSAKKGLSALQAARDLEMRSATVWSMMHRIRKAMMDDGKLLAGIVEMDETFVGAKRRNELAKRYKMRRPVNISPSVIETDTGYIASIEIAELDSEKEAAEIAQQLAQLFVSNMQKQELNGDVVSIFSGK